MLEKTIEAYLVAQVKKRGGIPYKFVSPQRRSVPDRLVVFPGGRICFVELKQKGKKPTPLQAAEHERLRALECAVFVIDSKEGVDEWLSSYDHIRKIS